MISILKSYKFWGQSSLQTSPKANNYYNTKMKTISMSASTFLRQNGQANCENSRQGRQELIVQINIGRQGHSSEIRLLDINNSSYIDSQIKSFIKQQSLKESAFVYIKEIISKQIARRRDEIYQANHSKCSAKCKCKDKMHSFIEKEKKILGVISLTNNAKSPSCKSKEKSIKTSSSPQRISIKITPISRNSLNHTNQRLQENVFNKTMPLDDESAKQDAYISKNMDSLKRKEKVSRCDSLQSYFSIENPEHTRTSESSFTKSRLPQRYSINLKHKSSNSLVNIQRSNSRNCKLVSTKERKQALMTPKKVKQTQQLTLEDILQLNEANRAYNQQFIAQSTKIVQKILEAPLFPAKCVPQVFQPILSQLFIKMTENNPPGTTELLAQYVSYQKLQEKQLQLMSTLFEKMDLSQISKLNYSNFRINVLKYCWKTVEQLVMEQRGCVG